MTQHLLTDGNIDRRITRPNPKPHPINPHNTLFRSTRPHRHELHRTRHIAQTLGHFPRILVEDKAVCDERLVGREAADGERGEERGLEPTAVLVCAFEVEVCLAGEHGPARSAVEPDVHGLGAAAVLARESGGDPD